MLAASETARTIQLLMMMKMKMRMMLLRPAGVKINRFEVSRLTGRQQQQRAGEYDTHEWMSRQQQQQQQKAARDSSNCMVAIDRQLGR